MSYLTGLSNLLQMVTTTSNRAYSATSVLMDNDNTTLNPLTSWSVVTNTPATYRAQQALIIDGTSSTDIATSVKIDSRYTYVSGSFSNSNAPTIINHTFSNSGVSIATIGGGTAFVARYNQGFCDATLSVDGTGFEGGTSIATDLNGGMILGGTYNSSNPSIWSSYSGGVSNLSPIRLPAPLGSNVGFAIKFAGQIFSSPSPQFAVGVDSIGTENINAVASDNANNMYLAGSYTNRGSISQVYDAVTTLSNYYAFSGINEVTSSQRQSLESLSSIATMCSDTNGNIYVGRLSIIMRVSPNGGVMNIAGNDSSPNSNIAFDGVGSNAGFNIVTAMCLDTDGNLLVTERHRIRRVTPNGVVTTVAGSFTSGFSDAIGTNACFNFVQGICTDSNGNIYVADNANNRIRRITPQGVVSTWAGQATWGDTDGVGTNAAFFAPYGLTIDTAGNLFVVEQSACRIRRITPSQSVSFVAGNPNIANSGTSFADGVGSNARFHFPRHIMVDPYGTLYVSDTINNRIRRIVGSTVSTIAGNGTGTNIDSMGTLASMFAPDAMCFDINGNILFADSFSSRLKSIEMVGCVVNTFAGTGTATFSNGTGITAAFNQPISICTDSAGNVYVADRSNHRIRRITRSGVVSTFAGSGVAGFSDATGTNALFNLPNIVTIDRNQNIYVAEIGSHQVRMITPSGTVTRIAGSTVSGFSDATGTNARFNTIQGLVVDAAGNIFVADTLNFRIRRITPAGVVTTFAGSTNSMIVNGTGTNASFWSPRGMCIDSSGNIILADHITVRRITPSAVVTIIAGQNALSGYSDALGTNALLDTGTPSITVDANDNYYITQSAYHNIRKVTSAGVVSTVVTINYTGGYLDGRNSVARFNSPNGIWYDNVSGNLYVADTSNHRIRVIEPPMSTRTFVGNGISGPIDGIGTNASVNAPGGLTIDSSGNFIVVGGSMSMGYTRRITPRGEISHLAGSTSFGATNGTGTNASFYLPTSCCVDSTGNIYVADFLNNMIRRVAPNRTVTTFAGQINAGYSDATGTNAAFNGPVSIDIDSSGNLYVAESTGHRIRMIAPSGVVSTVAGNGLAGFSNASGTNAQFNSPNGICVVPNSNPAILYVGDRNNNRVRLINSGVVSTFAGSGVSGSVDSNGTNAQFTGPGQITIDTFGNLYVGDAPRIRKITSSGLVTTIVGSGTTTYMEGVGTNASFNNIAGLCIDANGNLYVSDTSSHRIRMVSRVGVRTVSLDVSQNVNLPSSQVYTGRLSSTPYLASAYSEATTFAGSGTATFIDGTLTTAGFNSPQDLFIALDGTIYISDTANHCIRRISTSGEITTIAGSTLSGFSNSIGTNARFNSPRGICVDSQGRIYVADNGNHQVRRIATDGTVSTFAGSQSSGFSDATGTNAQFTFPNGLYIDGTDQLYLCDRTSIRRISQTAVVTRIAGSSSSTGFSDATGSNALFNAPTGLVVDTNGNIFVADQNNHRIRQVTQSGVVTTFAGTNPNNFNNGTGTNAAFAFPYGISIDPSNNLYIGDQNTMSIRRITPGAGVSTIANGVTFSVNYRDGVGSNALFARPHGVFVHPVNGNLFITDRDNHRIRRLELAGVSVSTYAGSGTATFTDANGIFASFNNPFGICVDENRNLYVADFNNHRIRRITPSGQVTTLAGSRFSGFSDGIGTNARFNNPNGICIDRFGNLYVSDSGNNRIRKITSTGAVTTLAGSSTAGFSDASGTNALFNGLNGICVDSNGNVYVADYNNNRIRLITQSGNVTTYAGNGTATTANGTGTNASFNTPIGIAIDSTGVVYVTEYIGRVVRRISTSQVVSTLAGSGSTGSADGIGTNASFVDLFYCCTDSSNNLLLCDRNHRIRKISQSGVVSTLAGSGTATFLDGIGTSAGFNTPAALCVDLFGTIYVSDYTNNRIRMISSPMISTTFAGSGTATFFDATGISAGFNTINAVSIDSTGNIYVIEDANTRPRRISPARVVTSMTSANLLANTSGFLFGPSGIASDLNGNIFISDTGNHRIQRISSAGVVSTFAGAGFAGWLDDTGVNAQFNLPAGIAIDFNGNLFLADQLNHRIRRITQAGVVTTIAGSGTQGFSDGVGTNAMFNQPYALCLDTIGNIYVADRGNNRIRMISPNRFVNTLAGQTTAGFSDAIGTNAQFNLPQGIAIDSSGNLYVADRNTQRIRRVTQSGVVTTIVGSGTATHIDGIGTNSGFNNPIGMCIDNNDNLYVAANNRIRRISTLYNSSYFVDVGTSSSNMAAFAIKYDNVGKSLWSVTLDGASTDACMAMTTDTSQNVYLSGYYGPNRTLIYQNILPSRVMLPATLNNTQGAFCTKIDSSGAVQWAVTMDGANNEQALGTAVDSFGNVYITGSYGSNATMIYNANTSYSGIVLPAVSNIGCFLVKYNPSGNAEWANTIRGVSSNIGYSILIDNTNNIYVGGTYQGNVSPIIYGPNNSNTPFSLPAPTGNNGSNTAGFVVRYNTSGTPLNVWGITGTSNAGVYSVAVDETGNNIAMAGIFTGSANTNLLNTNSTSSSISLPSSVSTQAAYVARYSLSNTPLSLSSSSSNGHQKFITNATNSNIVINIMNSNNTVVNNSYTIGSGSNSLLQFFAGNWYKFI